MSQVRLQHYISKAGLASRRKAEACILAGKVRVNDVVVRELGTRIDPEVDRVLFEGKPIRVSAGKQYLLLHKPRGVIVSKQDEMGRKTVFDLLANLDPSLNAVGRLDLDSEGLLLLTNDGELQYRLTHPSYEIPKIYQVCLNRLPLPKVIQQLERGIDLEEGKTSRALIQVLSQRSSREESNSLPVGQDQKPHAESIRKTFGVEPLWVSIQIHEGKKRQVRRMFEWAGCKVLRLIRVKLGPLELGNLKPGKSRLLTSREIHQLKLAVGMSPAE